ncbi:SAM-dependent methyltransferase [Kineosporia babensis]|uniref:SAM-dependent methyltransferase n=1 Tax=Kineosporia babensis TaxID=499548 RepID=A0A9X1SUP6_9ACTN|nr:SAM-dependent methyltransferase [Kineosporia babensis]MCD5313197.1 SAM-dependent methyltransferase [Kineosporia babensis]
MLQWQDAWQRALYGPGGFYRRPEGPAGHFRTASHAAPDELAEAIARLAVSVGASRIVDVGAGRGELLTSLVSQDLKELWGVDVVARPPGLPSSVQWAAGLNVLPDEAFEDALVIVWELLDVVPLPVLEIDERGCPSLVLVDPRTGREKLAGPPRPQFRLWIDEWWPPDALEEGDRLEVGLPRDLFWRDLTERAWRAGARAALCVDYAHTRSERPAQGSLTGFRSGRAVPPRPDGSMDLTAHVAIDSIAGTTMWTTQADALAELGVRDQELLDPGGLGGFAWLLQMP